MSELFDFSQVVVENNGSYLAPGHYNVSVKDVSYDKTGTPALVVTFANKQGSMVKEKFWLTAKALPRLQYLHEAWFGKKLEKAFKSVEEIVTYFTRALTAKEIRKNIIVSGNEADNGKVYGNLKFLGFVLPDTVTIEEGPFAEGTTNYIENVKKNSKSSAASLTDTTILPGDDSDDDDDLPF